MAISTEITKDLEKAVREYPSKFKTLREEIEAFPFQATKATVAIRFPRVEEKTAGGIIKPEQMLKEEKLKLTSGLGVTNEDYAMIVSVGEEAYKVGYRVGQRIITKGSAFEVRLPGIPTGVYGIIEYYDLSGYLKGTEVNMDLTDAETVTSNSASESTFSIEG